MHMRLFRKNVKFLVIILLFSASIASAQVQYGWRGNGQSGIYNETGLFKSWPATGPALIWEATGIGTGYSSVTATPDDIYITGRKGDKDVLTAFTQGGKKKWELIYGSSSTSNFPDSRCTPSFYNGKILLVSGMGDMVCVSMEGKIIWSVNYFQKYNSKIPMFGVSESPIVVDGLVIGTPGGLRASMVAFNIETGKVVWEAPSIGEGTNYVNPVLIQYEGVKMIVTVTEGYLIAVNIINGKLLWKYNYEAANAKPNGDKNHANTPIYYDGYLCVANGYEQIAVKLKLNTAGTGPTLIWKNTDLTPHIGGMVLLGNYIYSSTHDTNSKGRWICVDWTTGKTMWITDWKNKGPVISADGMNYIIDEKSGYVGLVNPTPEKLDIVSSFRIAKGSGPYWAHPVIDKGRLFVRHGDYIAVYSLR
jgi:outer membrane protein assembly factor BamB